MGHIEVRLPPAHTLLIDSRDKDLLSAFKWRAFATNKKKQKYYCVAWIGHTPLYLHRMILNAPEGMVVDHINGNGLDCRRKNMRICTQAENAQNSHGWAKRLSQHSFEHPVYKGVWRISRHKSNHTGRIWEARLCWEKKQRYIGAFDLPELAAMAYDDWARCFHGRFARLNFPNPGEIGVHDQ